MKRTHHCSELRPAHAGQAVTLEGWVHSRRDLGGVIFIDVRDREGRTQTVFDPSDLPPDVFERAAALRSECVVRVTGKVRLRPSGTTNPKIETGEVEVMATNLEVLNVADVLPFPVDDPEAASKVNEELRLKYRYLDLRRPEMIRNLRLRSKVAAATQNQAMNALVFLYKRVLNHALQDRINAVRADQQINVPVVMTREEVAAVISLMNGTAQLVATLLYGSGLRIMEAVRLRVKDIDFQMKQLTVRSGKGDKDRVTVLPGIVKAHLSRHPDDVRAQHQRDLAAGPAGSSYRPPC